MGKTFYRIKQFIATRKTNLSYLEIDFVRKYLNHQEQILFFRMKGFDQRHALLVANKCLEKTVDVSWIDKAKMARVALLHDVGKSSADIGVFLRIIYVLINSIKEGKYIKFFAKENSRLGFKRKLFILSKHGSIGNKMLTEIDCTDKDVLQCVANHHDSPEVNESKMLPILRDVDSTL